MPIRRAVAGDLPAVTALVERAFARYVERIGRRPAPMDDDYGAHIARGDAFVCGEPLAGLVVCVDEPGGLHVLCLAVEPGHQGAGLGRALMGYAEAVSRERQLPEVRVYTNAAMTESLAFYPRLGYRQVDRRVEDGYSRVYFVK